MDVSIGECMNIRLCAPENQDGRVQLVEEPQQDLQVSQALSQTENLFVNSRLNDHYQYVGCIGAGGVGYVFKAKHRFLDRMVAIKMLHCSGDSGNILMRFQREAQSIANLSHPGIVKVDDFGVLDDGQPFMVLEFVEGYTLADLIDCDRNRTVSLNRLISIFVQVAEAVGHAHSKHILHRDLKPSNVLLTKDASGNELVKVVDFGLAKVGDTQSITTTNELCGSPPYMSPEQITRRAADERSDIYSFGCLMYECLTGRPPLMGTSALSTLCLHVTTEPQSLNLASPRRLPAALTAIVMKALEKEPHKRFESMAEIIEQLDAILGRHSHRAPTADVTEPHNFCDLSSGKDRAIQALTTRLRISATFTEQKRPSARASEYQSFMIAVAIASVSILPAGFLIANILGSFKPLARVRDPEQRAKVMDVVLTARPSAAAVEVQEFVFGTPLVSHRDGPTGR